MSKSAWLSRPQPEVRKVSLLRIDEEFRQAVPENERALAERTVGAVSCRLPEGAWEPAAIINGAGPPIAAVVVDGLITTDVALAGTVTAHLSGPGDILGGWEATGDALPMTTLFTVSPGGATVALLGESFRLAQERWVGLTVCLQRRTAQLAAARLVRVAIASMPRTEQRLVALFWHLAERWGTVHPEGIRIHLKLTHEALGRLAAAKRPTVSLALSYLAEHGALRSDGDGWLLSHESATWLGTSARGTGNRTVALRRAQPGPQAPTAEGQHADNSAPSHA